MAIHMTTDLRTKINEHTAARKVKRKITAMRRQVASQKKILRDLKASGADEDDIKEAKTKLDRYKKTDKYVKDIYRTKLTNEIEAVCN